MYRSVFLWLLLMLCLTAGAQQPARTFYFMDNAPVRLNLNPAMQPIRGYFSFPLLGAIGVSATTNTLTVDDFLNIMDEGEDFLYDDRLMGKLKKNNYANIDLGIDLISFGFYSGKGFWTFDIGAKVLMNVSIPQSMFEFARNYNNLEEEFENGKLNYDIRDLRLHMDLCAQIGLGYSRPVNDWLTVGGKLKLLVGAGNVDLQIKKMKAESRGRDEWRVETEGDMQISMKGLEVPVENDQVSSDFDLADPISEGDLGVAGYGLGLDLGVTARVWKNLSVSAAVIDLGRINWSSGATTVAHAEAEQTISVDGLEDGNGDQGGISPLDLDLFRFGGVTHGVKRHTSLIPKMNIGVEYGFWENRVGVGLLSTTHFYRPQAYSELTLSANFRPGSWFGATISYSFLHSDFKTLGLGLRLGPIFLATDYLPIGDLKSISRANLWLGVNFPIGPKGGRMKQADKGHDS